MVQQMSRCVRACLVVATLLFMAPRPAVSAEPAPAQPTSPLAETEYRHRTDGFAEKMALLETAWQRQDFRLARALVDSLRDTLVQAQVEEESPGTPLVPAARFVTVASLPAAWRTWARGWNFCQAVHLDESAGFAREREPVELLVACPAEQAMSLEREVRVARVTADGTLREVPCQTHGEVRRGSERLAKVLFMAEVPARQRQTYLVFHGNPDAELPAYVTDLETRGEGFGLDVENDFFTAVLSRQMGRLERLTIKREHGLELFAGGDGHGEPPAIDWAHDYVAAGGFQKLRIGLWETCPDYEVVRGPLCTIVRRWGFPASPMHPVFTPSRLNVDVEYRFYAGLPWFLKVASMQATKDFEVTTLRDDQWVFSGQSFRESLWMGADGKVQVGTPPRNAPVAAVGYANRESEDAIVALFLEHRAEGLPELNHGVLISPMYRWHGAQWERYPLLVKHVPAGAVLRQKNAYALLPFGPEDGPRAIEDLRSRLVNPLAASAGEVRAGAAGKECLGRLARPGEAGDGPIPKRALWDALHDCKDKQFYKADVSVVDLGLVYDLRVRGGTVEVVMAMPHRGRPRLDHFADGSGGNTTPVKQRLLQVPGVEEVVVRQTWEPPWNSNRLTDEGREKLGLPALAPAAQP